MAAGKGRIFVVEDHPATARGLKMFLEISGYVVETAHTMRTALETTKKNQFDVMLCDLNLPDGTGWELMESLGKRGPVRGIAFSAFDEPEHIARSKAAGFLEHVVKGVTPEEIIAAIDRAMRDDDRARAVKPKRSRG